MSVRIAGVAVIVAALFATGGCSINQLAVQAIAGALTGGSGENPFTSDNDPELIADALPFALKLFDTLLQADPENAELWLTAGQGYISYAGGVLQPQILTLPDERYRESAALSKRAANLYSRGADQTLVGLDLNHPGFREAFLGGDLDTELANMTESDVPYLYWLTLGSMGELSLDPLNIELGSRIPSIDKAIQRAFELDPTYGNGAIHEFFVTYYGALPPSLGGDKSRARYHFEQALELSEGQSAGLYIAMARITAIPDQDVELFRSLLTQSLAVDVDANPSSRLINVVSQRQARWYLDNIEQFFFELDE